MPSVQNINNPKWSPSPSFPYSRLPEASSQITAIRPWSTANRPFLISVSNIWYQSMIVNQLETDLWLLSSGNYQPQIDQALADAQAVEKGTALFFCVGGANGVISYITTCEHGCHDSGTGNNDFCNWISWGEEQQQQREMNGWDYKSCGWGDARGENIHYITFFVYSPRLSLSIVQSGG